MKKLLIIFFLLLSQLALFASDTYTVTSGGLNARKHASINSEVIKIFHKDDTVKGVLYNKKWLLVKDGDESYYLGVKYLKQSKSLANEYVGLLIFLGIVLSLLLPRLLLKIFDKTISKYIYSTETGIIATIINCLSTLYLISIQILIEKY